MADIAELQAELDRVNAEGDRINAERDRAYNETRDRARELRQERDRLYAEAIRKRDAIGKPAIYASGIVTVYDPDLLDADTLAVLDLMGTPVPPVDEVYPGGVFYPDGRKGRN